MEIVVGLAALLATTLVVVGGTIYVVSQVFKHSKGARWAACALAALVPVAACIYYVYTPADAPPEQAYATPDGRITFRGPPGILIAQPKEKIHELVYKFFQTDTSRDGSLLNPARAGNADQTPPGMVLFMTIIEDTNTRNPNVTFDEKHKNVIGGWMDNHNGHSPVTKEGVTTINGMPARYAEMRMDYELTTTYMVMYAIDAGDSYLTVTGHQPHSAVHDVVNTMRTSERTATPPTPATTNP